MPRPGSARGCPTAAPTRTPSSRRPRTTTSRQGALGETACALQNQLPQIANLRAYTPELVGWFDGFSTSGSLDASGGLGRIAASFNPFTVSDTGLVDLLDPLDTDIGELLKGANLEMLDVGNHARCPGGARA